MVSAWKKVLAEFVEPGRPLTLEEWAALPEDVPGELVDGHLVEEEMPDPVHGLAVSWLIALLRGWLGTRGGFVFDSDVKLVMSSGGGRKADVAVYFPDRDPPPRRGALRSPPDLVVEVVSASPRDERRDRVDKMQEYAAAGIRFYWIVDPALGSFEIFELTERARYAQTVALTSGRIDPVVGCQGLVIDVDALWSELARLAPED